MKNSLSFIAAIAVLCFTACGQTSKEVPSQVKAAFSRKFPAATGIKWDKENDNEWEAEFKVNGKAYSANFDNAGTWMETEYVISVSEIPAAVKASLDSAFTAYEIEKSEASETPEGKVCEFKLKKGEEETEVTIDMNGKILKKEQGNKEEEDKD
jgi:hypothetical protein